MKRGRNTTTPRLIPPPAHENGSSWMATYGGESASRFFGLGGFIVHAELVCTVATIFFDFGHDVGRRGDGRRTIAGLRRPAGVIHARPPRVAAEDHPGWFAEREIAHVWLRGGWVGEGN